MPAAIAKFSAGFSLGLSGATAIDCGKSLASATSEHVLHPQAGDRSIDLEPLRALPAG
jgi:hypothetical protein